jgi:hypothetical protein
MVHRRAADAEAGRKRIEIGIRLAPSLRSGLSQPIRQSLQLAIGLEPADRLELPVRRAHRAREVRLLRIEEAVEPIPDSRG